MFGGRYKVWALSCGTMASRIGNFLFFAETQIYFIQKLAIGRGIDGATFIKKVDMQNTYEIPKNDFECLPVESRVLASTSTAPSFFLI